MTETAQQDQSAASTTSSTRTHLVGLLLGAEEDWPTAFEALLALVGPITTDDGVTHELTSERLTIEPFDLRQPVRTELVIDRLAYWYYHPREWLKKAALMNDTYLLNSPFTFQSMEKHSAYVALMRLGLKVPETWLVPYKNPVDNVRWAYTSAKYNRPVRPQGDRQPARLPDVHEALRRRRLARRLPDQRRDATSSRPTTSPARCSCTCSRPSSTTTSRGPCRSVPRRWSWTSVPSSRCTTGMP